MIFILQRVVASQADKYDNVRQQDSHEFLLDLLSWLHDELKPVNYNVNDIYKFNLTSFYEKKKKSHFCFTEQRANQNSARPRLGGQRFTRRQDFRGVDYL